MKNIESTYFRILSIAPSSRGFGFAVLKGQEKLIDWGVKSIKGKKNKNARTVEKVKEAILQHVPEVIVLEDASSKESRRSARIRALGKKIVALAKSLDVKVVLFSRAQVRKAFFADGQGTKHALAEILAERFPQELAFRLPPKRRAWTSEDSRMDIFDAVALALVFSLKKKANSLAVDNIY
jgi:Holliday junction resolvasome RuvABC endonuclease subunit